MNLFLPYAALLAIGTVWGATIPLSKISVSTGHHSFGLITWQLAIMSAVLGAIVLVRRSKIHLDRSHLLFFLVIAFTGTLVPNSFSYWTAFHLPAGVLSLIIAVVPVFSLIIATAFKLEKPTLARLAGVFLGGCAIALIVLPQASLPDPAKAIFVLIGLIAPFCYGIEGNYVAQKQPDDTGPFATLFVASVIGLLIAAPVSLASSTMIDPRDGIGLPELALIAASLLHIIAYSGYLWLNKFAGAVFAAQVSYVVTPAGVLIAIALLGEEPSVYIWLALAVLMIGIALVQPRHMKS